MMGLSSSSRGARARNGGSVMCASSVCKHTATDSLSQIYRGRGGAAKEVVLYELQDVLLRRRALEPMSELEAAAVSAWPKES